jgi:hypothetical protein
MSMERVLKWELAWETEILGENLPSATSTTNPTLDRTQAVKGGKAETNRLSYNTARGMS